MVIPATSNYTMQTHTPILNAKVGKHYARLMYLSLIWSSPLIFVRKMILKVIGTSGSMWMPPVLPLCEFLNHIYVFDIVYSKIVDN